MDIRTKKRYYFNTEEQEFCCEVDVYLPSKNGVIDKLLRNEEVAFLGSPLNVFIGNYDEQERSVIVKYIEFDKDLDNLKKIVNKTLELEIDKLKKVIEINKEKIDKTPENEELIFNYKGKEIKVEKIYSFITENQVYECVCKIKLPADKDGNLDKDFIKPYIKFFGVTLDNLWGGYDKEEGVKVSFGETITEEDIEELKRSSDDYIRLEIEKLEEYDRYVENNKIEESEETIDEKIGLEIKKGIYRNEINEYICILTVSINSDEYGNLPEIIMNNKEEFFGEKLSVFWGKYNYETKKRKRKVELEDKDLDTLKKKVDEYIDEQINKLRRIIDINEKKISYLSNNELIEETIFKI